MNPFQASAVLLSLKRTVDAALEMPLLDCQPTDPPEPHHPHALFCIGDFAIYARFPAKPIIIEGFELQKAHAKTQAERDLCDFFLQEPWKTNPPTPIHLCPPNWSGIMPCCGKTPFEIPPTDRMTSDPSLSNCHDITRQTAGEIEPG